MPRASRQPKPHRVLGPNQKERVSELKKMGVEDPRKYLISGLQEGFTGKQVVKAAEGGGKRNTRITENPIYAGSGSGFAGGGGYTKPPSTIEGGVRVQGAGSSTPVSNPPAFFESGGGAGGGAGGGNPLTAGTASAALEAQDLDSVLHGAKKKGRVRKTRGTE